MVWPTVLSHVMFMLISFRKSIPPQNLQLIVYHYVLEYKVEVFRVGVDLLNLIDKYIM